MEYIRQASSEFCIWRAQAQFVQFSITGGNDNHLAIALVNECQHCVDGAQGSYLSIARWGGEVDSCLRHRETTISQTSTVEANNFCIVSQTFYREGCSCLVISRCPTACNRLFIPANRCSSYAYGVSDLIAITKVAALIGESWLQNCLVDVLMKSYLATNGFQTAPGCSCSKTV